MIRIAALFLFFFATSTLAATVPTGIPEPPFGLDETVANTVGSGDNSYYTHWVDNSGACSDAGNGTPANPRCTIPTGTFSAGTVIQLRGGPYTISSDFGINGTGTAGSPIFLRGPDYDNRVTINLNGHQMGSTGSYVVFEYLKTIGRDEAMVFSSSNHCVVRYCEIQGTGTTADSAGGVIVGTSSSYLVRAYNVIHDCGDWQNANQNDMHGLSVASNQTYTWDLYNTIYHMGGDGSGNGHDANHTTYNLYIGGNTFYEERENCIDLKEVHNVIISENICRNITASSSSSEGGGIVVHYGPTSGQGPYNIWVINNTIHDVVSGIATSDNESGIYIIGNLFYDMDAAMYHNASSGGSYYFMHNTMVDVGVGEYWGASMDYLLSAGNIAAYATAQELRSDMSDGRAASDMRNDLMYRGGSNLQILWGSTYTSITAWIAGTTEGDGSIQDDPGFTNYAGNDFSIASGSAPGVDNGWDMTTIMSTFNSAFGTNLNKDLAGASRPTGVWDIGAYEYAAAGDTTPPTVDAFTIPASSNSLTVSISAFTASDAVGVTGYCINESATPPTAGSCSGSGWEATAQTSYVFSTPGTKTLYPWAKDAAGNISDSASQYDQVNIIFKGVYGTATFSNAAIR